MPLEVNLSQYVSKHFTLRELTKTNTGLPNLPTISDVSNIKKLGVVLDHLYDTIGPFTLHSGFRTHAVQGAVGSTARKSFHELGLAADFTPTTMSAEEFFAKIIANPMTRNMLGEISHKPTQNAIHLSVATPGKVGVIMERDSIGNYVRLAQNEITSLISKYVPEAIQQAGLSLGASLFALGGFLFYMIKKK